MKKSSGFKDTTSVQAWLQQQNGQGFRNPDADVKAAGPLIDISRTIMLVIVKMQIGIPPNISPFLAGFPSRQPFTIPKTIAED